MYASHYLVGPPLRLKDEKGYELEQARRDS
jgi:hypothetical protein